MIQKYVRMFVQLRKFRRETEMGRRRAAQAAVDAETRAAAVVLQKYRRRVIATRKVLHTDGTPARHNDPQS